VHPCNKSWLSEWLEPVDKSKWVFECPNLIQEAENEVNANNSKSFKFFNVGKS